MIIDVCLFRIKWELNFIEFNFKHDFQNFCPKLLKGGVENQPIANLIFNISLKGI